MRDLPRIVAESPVGKEVSVKVVRKGAEIDLTVTLGRLEDGEKLAASQAEDPESSAEDAPVATAAALGMTFGELDDAARESYGINDDVSGVLVTAVDANSLAAERGVMAGDVITEIAQESVDNPQDVLDRIEELKSQGRKNALLMLSSKTGELRFVTIRMD